MSVKSESHPSRLVRLAENHLLLGPVQGSPGADPALHRAPHTGTELRMTPPVDPLCGSTLEHRHGAQTG
jgi:hypothetical protein